MKLIGKNITFNNNKVYHAGDKPTTSELGAADRLIGTNIVPNADFADGTTGFSGNNASVAVAVAGELEATVTVNSTAGVVINTGQIGSLSEKYFFRFDIKPFRTHSVNIMFNMSIVDTGQTATAGVWTTITVPYNIVSNGTAITPSIMLNGAVTTGQAVGSKVSIRKPMIIPLASAYGSNFPSSSIITEDIDAQTDAWIQTTGELESLKRISNRITATETTLSQSITQASLLNLVYPVGSIYMSVNNVSPATFLGGTWASFSNGRMLVGYYASDADFNAAEKFGGSKTHTLSVSEMPVHTHTQNAHTHTQDAHTHTQNAHTHTQDAHNHTQAAHTHTQDANTWMNDASAYDSRPSGTTGFYMGAGRKTYYTGSSTPAINSTTATNQNTTATNNNTTATNQSTTATNNNAGSGAAHNNMPPYMVVYMWKRTA